MFPIEVSRAQGKVHTGKIFRTKWFSSEQKEKQIPFIINFKNVLKIVMYT